MAIHTTIGRVFRTGKTETQTTAQAEPDLMRMSGMNELEARFQHLREQAGSRDLSPSSLPVQEHDRALATVREGEEAMGSEASA